MSERIWVVEMFCIDRWEPTGGVGLDRADGRDELKRWGENNPQDRFRLKPYFPALPETGGESP